MGAYDVPRVLALFSFVNTYIERYLYLLLPSVCSDRPSIVLVVYELEFELEVHVIVAGFLPKDHERTHIATDRVGIRFDLDDFHRLDKRAFDAHEFLFPLVDDTRRVQAIDHTAERVSNGFLTFVFSVFDGARHCLVLCVCVCVCVRVCGVFRTGDPATSQCPTDFQTT